MIKPHAIATIILTIALSFSILPTVFAATTISTDINTGGTLTVTGASTSTFSAGLQALYLNITGTLATSTFARGIDLSGGCFAINGVCIGSGLVSYTDAAVNSYIHGSSTIPKTYTANTFSGLQAFSNTGTTTFAGGIRGTYLDLTGSSATSTATKGFNLTGGCFAINSVCLGATSPANASGTVQYNANSIFGGNSSFTFDGTTVSMNSLSLASGGTIKVGGSTLLDSSGNLNVAVVPLQDTAANLSATVPASGQMVYETNTKYSKVGDGSTSIGNLKPLNPFGTSGSNLTFFGHSLSLGSVIASSSEFGGGLAVLDSTGSLFVTDLTVPKFIIQDGQGDTLFQVSGDATVPGGTNGVLIKMGDVNDDGHGAGGVGFQFSLDQTQSRFIFNGGGLQLNPGQDGDGINQLKPICNSGTRGEFWYNPADSGVKDTVEVCAKDASNAYAWRTIY